MRAHATSAALKRIALLLVCSACAASLVSAQTVGGTKPNLEALLVPGMTVWITDSGGREEKTRVVGVSGNTVTIAIDDDIRRLVTAEIMRVSVRQSDPLINGALIGAGAAVASGLFLCTRTEPWRNCRDDIGPMLRIGAIGAGVGIGLDALIRGRRTIYEAAPGSTRLHATPLIGPRTGGLLVSLTF